MSCDKDYDFVALADSLGDLRGDFAFCFKRPIDYLSTTTPDEIRNSRREVSIAK